jgi:hypothetical protein
MEEIRVRRAHPEAANIEQLSVAREWMDNTVDKHAYMCFPMTIANSFGWGISFNTDIKVIWNGVEDSFPEHVTILAGESIAHTGRAHATVSFETGLVINTSENISMLTMPVPNQYIPGIQTMTTLMSTSFYRGHFPLAMKITEPNREIFIPARTPVAAILPISVKKLQTDFTLKITEGDFSEEYWDELVKYGAAVEAKNSLGDWSRMYRDAVNYDGSSIGKHESKNVKLKTITCPVTGATSETTD